MQHTPSSRVPICALWFCVAAVSVHSILGCVRQHDEEAVRGTSARRVTLDCERAPLQDLVQAIGAQAGVRLIVDAALANEPVLAVVHDRRADEVLRAIAWVTGGVWCIRNGGRGPTWALSCADRQRRAERLTEASRRAAVSKLRREVRRLASLAHRSPRYLARLADARIVNASTLAARQLVLPCRCPMARLIGETTEECWSRLVQSGHVVWADDSPRALRLPPWVSAAFRVMPPVPPHRAGHGGRHSGDYGEWHAVWKTARAYRVHAFLTVTPGANGFDATLVMAPAAVGNTRGEWIYPTGTLVCRASTFDAPRLQGGGQGASMWASAAQMRRRLWLMVAPPDPRYEMPGTMRGDRVRRCVYEAARTSVVSDAYAAIESIAFMWPPPQQMTISDALARYVGSHRDWVWRSGLVHARSRAWFAVRHLEVPPAMARRWLRSRARSGRFTVQDYIEVAGDMAGRPVLAFLAWARVARIPEREIASFARAYPALRFLATLQPQQWSSLVAAAGLPAHRLTTAQRRALSRMAYELDVARLSTPWVWGFRPFQPHPDDLDAAVVRLRALHGQCRFAPATARGRGGKAHVPSGIALVLEVWVRNSLVSACSIVATPRS